MSRTPWIGLAALIGMFVLPYVPEWFFEGPRTIRHRPRRHICGDCGEPWTADHTCPPPAEVLGPVQGELRRLYPPTGLGRRAVPARRPGGELSRRTPQVVVDGARGVRWRRSRGRPGRPNRPYGLD